MAEKTPQEPSGIPTFLPPDAEAEAILEERQPQEDDGQPLVGEERPLEESEEATPEEEQPEEEVSEKEPKSEPVEEPTEAKTQEKETTPDPLDQTSFKSVDALVKSYKEIQAMASKTSSEKAQIQHDYQQLREEIANIKGQLQNSNTSEEDDYSDEEFVSKKDLDVYLSQKLNEATAKLEQTERQKRDQKIITEANKDPFYKANSQLVLSSLPRFRLNPDADYNPVKVASTILQEGLQDIYDKHPGISLEPDGGLELARTLSSTPHKMTQVKKEAVKKAKMNDIAAQNAAVATSSNVQEPNNQDFSKLSFEEMEKALGVPHETPPGSYLG
jgi:chemotaxis protein histidine kinase CheA